MLSILCIPPAQPEGVTWTWLLTGHLLLDVYHARFSQNLLMASVLSLSGQMPQAGGTLMAEIDGKAIL